MFKTTAKLIEYTDPSIIASRYNEAFICANKILAQVRKHFIFGSSNISPVQYSAHSDNYSVFPGSIEKNYTVEALLDAKIKTLAHQKLKTCRTEIKTTNAAQSPKMERSKLNYTYQKNRATISQQNGVGNCEELATFAFMELLQTPSINFSVEYMAFNEPLDHVFLVLNRNYSTEIYNWDSWNSTAIILDPWLGACYSPKEIRRLWQNNNRGTASPWLGIDYPRVDARTWKRAYQCWWAAPLISVKKEFDRDDFKPYINHN